MKEESKSNIVEMLSANSTSSNVHNEITKTQCAICVTEIGNQPSKDSRQMYKLCTKYLHSGIAKEIPDDCEFEATFSDKDQIPLCGKCLGSAKELEEVTGTLASLRKRVSDMVIIFTLEILHRRGKDTRKEEARMKLIKVDVSKLPDNDSWTSWRSPTFTATDEIVSAEIQENIDYVGCMDEGEIIIEDNIELVDHDLDIKDIVTIELMTEAEQVPIDIDGPLRNAESCATSESISSQENMACAAEIMNRFEVQNGSTETNASDIAVDEDVVLRESVDLTKCKDRQPKTITERNDKNLQNMISMPSVKLHRLSSQWKSNTNGQDIILVKDERKSNTIPKFEFIVKREPEVSTNNIPQVLHKVQNISAPSTSTSLLSVPMLLTDSNSKDGCDSVDMQGIRKKKTLLKRNVELARDSDQKGSYKNLKSKSKHSVDSESSLKGERFPCTVCKKTFLQNSQLLKHRTQHQKIRSHKCSLCPQRFSATTQLKTHQRVKHGDKTVKCAFCDKEFSHSENLRVHQRTHTGEKPCKCTSCKMSFSCRSHLNRHQRTHTGERPFKCSFCETEFSNKANLGRHLRTHTGEKPFNCTFCKMSFSQSTDLSTHIRIHTGDKPFKCDKCDYSSAQRGALTSHKIHRHSNKRSLKCRDCQRSFKTRNEIRKHHKNIHKNVEFTDECILPNN